MNNDNGQKRDYGLEFREGFTRVPNAVLVDRRLKASDRLVYWYLLARDYNDKKVSWPSQERIAEDTGLCIRTIIGCIRALVRYGYLEVKQYRTPDGKWRGNQYTLLVTAPERKKRRRHRREPKRRGTWQDLLGATGE